MSAEAGVRVRCVFVGKASRSQNHFDLDAGLKALFPKSKAFQLVQAEFLGSAVDSGVFEQVTTHTGMVDCRLDGSATTKVIRILSILELPGVVTLVMQQAWIVVSLIKIFEDAGEDLGNSKKGVSQYRRC